MTRKYDEIIQLVDKYIKYYPNIKDIALSKKDYKAMFDSLSPQEKLYSREYILYKFEYRLKPS